MILTIILGIFTAIGLLNVFSLWKAASKKCEIDEIEKWLRFHDELDDNYAKWQRMSRPDKEIEPIQFDDKVADYIFDKHDEPKVKSKETNKHREKWDWIWQNHEEQLHEKEKNKHGGINLEEVGKYTKLLRHRMLNVVENDKSENTIVETFYVLEIDNNYVEYVTEIYSDDILVGEYIRMCDSLSQSKKFETFDNAVEYASKHKITANIRLVKGLIS